MNEINNEVKIEEKTIDIEVQNDSTIDAEVEVASNNENIDVELERNQEIDVESNNNMEASVDVERLILSISSTKHNELQNRNLPNQHSIDAITGLRLTLDTLNPFKVNKASIQMRSNRNQLRLLLSNETNNEHVTVQDIKNLNTKIQSVDSESDINLNVLDKDDYIFIKS